MKEKRKSQLIDILKNNKKWPLIIESANKLKFPSAITIPANTPSENLGLIASENGIKYPTWAMQIMTKAKKSNNIIICIDSLDEIPQEDQEKFFGMIKYKGVNGFKFPEGSQIVITAKDANNISKRISGLALIFKAE